MIEIFEAFLLAMFMLTGATVVLVFVGACILALIDDETRLPVLAIALAWCLSAFLLLHFGWVG